MLGTIGGLYCRLGASEPCRKDLEQALAQQRAAPDAEPLQTAELLSQLGLAYGQQERWDDEERSQRAALKIYEARLPARDPRIAQTLGALGMALLTPQKIDRQSDGRGKGVYVREDNGG